MSKLIPLSGKHGKSRLAIIDDEDYAEISNHNWMCAEGRTTYYAHTYVNGRVVRMHRLIANATPGTFVDHKNRNGLDNRRCNLRIATLSSNAANRSTDSIPNKTSKYKGVSYKKRDGFWYSAIKKDGKSIHLGIFKDEVLAALAYNQKAIELFGEFALLNEIPVD